MMQNNRKRNAVSTNNNNNDNNNNNHHMPAKKLCKKRFEEQTTEETTQQTAESTTACSKSNPPILVQTATRLSPSPIQLCFDNNPNTNTNTNTSTRLQQQTIVSPIVPNATMISSYEDCTEEDTRQAREHNAAGITLPELSGGGAKKHEADLNSCVAAHNLLQLTRSMSPPSITHLLTPKICNIQKKKTTEEEAAHEEDTTTATVQQLNDYDVLCGRGAGTSNRPGNISYRNLIQRYSVAYRAASSTVDKNRIATWIVEEIQQRGRFMKKVSRTADYEVVITFKEIEDKVAVEKTCQALRDASSISSAATSPSRTALSLQAHYPKMATTTLTTSTDESSSSYIAKPISCDHMDMINENDVLLGRGGFTNNHTGNRRFRQLVQQYQLQYFHASKMEKPAIASMIVHKIRSSNPPGRFLKKSKMDEVTTTTDNADDDSVSSGGSSWKDVGDLRAREKVSQALREKAPELKAMYTTAKSLADLNVSPNPPAVEQGGVSSDATSTWVKVPRAAILKIHGGATATGATESVRSVSPHPTATAPNSPNHQLPSAQALANQIYVVGEHDVLCGRGAGVNNHPGNQRFRELVKMNRGEYKKTNSKKAKSEIAKSIVAAIYGNGGRFLKKVTQRSEDDECVWMDVGTHKANEKTSQALREGHTLSGGARSKQANASRNATSGQSLRIRVPLSYVC